MNNEIIRVLLVDDKVEIRQNYRRLLGWEDNVEIVGEAGNGREAIEVARRTRPDVIIMDINMPVMDGIRASGHISLELPDCSIVMVSVQGEEEYIRLAMQAGARDFLVKPFSNNDLIRTVVDVHKAEVSRRRALRQSFQKPTQLVPKAKEKEREGKIVTFFGSKGGVGKSTILLNTAIELVKKESKRVCIVDCDLQFGDLGIMLNISPTFTIADLVNEPSPWTKADLETFLTFHEESGLHLLHCPIRPEQSEAVTVEHIEKILKMLRKSFDLILVDTSPLFRELELTILDLSALILVVTSMDMSSVKNTKLCIGLLRELKYPDERIKLILNRGFPRSGGIDVDDVQRSLRREVSALIPSKLREMMAALNRGAPIMLTNPPADLASCFKRLAEFIVVQTGGVTEQDKEQGPASLLGRFKGLFSDTKQVA